MPESKNAGRIFRAWCGGQYIFFLNERGQLALQPYWDPFEFMKNWERSWTRKAPVEFGQAYQSWWGEINRRREKAQRFKTLYGPDLPDDPKPRIPDPAEVQTITGRMVVNRPPMQF